MTYVRRMLALVLVACGSLGCASAPPPAMTRPAPPSDINRESAPEDGSTMQMAMAALQPSINDYAVVRVMFATDRNQILSEASRNEFGIKRAKAFSYGTCDVSIPRDHLMGEMETPSIWRLEFRPNPSAHITVLRTQIQDKQRFFADLGASARGAGKQSSLLFVHGYNVSFEDAARRTAQIAYDLGFEGVPVFYSWPSVGKEAAYMADEQSVEWTESGLTQFLVDYLSTPGVDHVYIIAHSMGNRALTRSLAAALKDRPELAEKVGEIVLAAPDIDAEVFRDQIAPAMVALKRPITLYASSEDRALAASKFVHRYPRAGDSGATIVVVPGIDTIDASTRRTDFIGHSYFGDSDSILADMFYMFRGRPVQERFGLFPMRTSEGAYWVFAK